MSLEDTYDDNIREAVCEILMEDLLSQFDADGARFCATLFALLDREKQQQQQLDTITTNTLPITIPPTNTNI